MWYIYTMQNYSVIKKDNFAICNMYGLGGYYSKWNKSEMERQVLFDITYTDDYFNVSSNKYLIISLSFYFEFYRKQEFESVRCTIAFLLLYLVVKHSFDLLICQTLRHFRQKSTVSVMLLKTIKKRRQQLSLLKNSWPNNFESICQMPRIKL